MRGADVRNGSLFSDVDLEARVPARHPLRKIKTIVDAALVSLDAEFASLYASEGRPSIPPERLLRAALVQILFSIGSERQLMEQLQYNLLFRWFVGISIDEVVWVPTVFTKNRDRLMTTDMSQKFLAAILAHDKVAPLLSDEHFSVMRDACLRHDGTLMKAWASFKSFKPMPPPDSPSPPDASPPPETTNPTDTADQAGTMATIEATSASAIGHDTAVSGNIGRNVERDWRGQSWSNATHASLTDPDARLYRKGAGRPAQLCCLGHALAENRNGLIVGATLTHAEGTVERSAAIDMLNTYDPGGTRRLTLAADKRYNAAAFVATLREMHVTPHIAAKTRGSAVDARTTRHPGYAISQRKRKLIEEVFGWGKTVGPITKTMLRGLERVRAQFTLTMAAYNLARLPRLITA